MSNYVRNFGVKNYYNQTTIPQLIANNMSGCFFSETRCRVELSLFVFLFHLSYFCLYVLFACATIIW